MFTQLSELSLYGLPQTVALAAVAVVGYLFGRKRRGKEAPAENSPATEEIQRATRIARQLETIADELRQDLSYHRSRVEKFKKQINSAEINGVASESKDAAWQNLQAEAESVLVPTLQLVGQLSSAYDRIRQQSQALANFTGGRTDPQTGLSNSRALEEYLAMLLERSADNSNQFSVAILSVEQQAGESTSRDQREARLTATAKLLQSGLRESDVAGRYGMDELVVLMPGTKLDGARVFGERFLGKAFDSLDVAVCCGLAESQAGDTPKSLLGRADSAAYSARAAGPRRQFMHSGGGIVPADAVPADALPANAVPADEPDAVLAS